MDSFATEAKLNNGTPLTISLLDEHADCAELLEFINALICERVHIYYDREFTLKEQEEWKKSRLEAIEKNKGLVLLGRVGDEIAGTSSATLGKWKEKKNCDLGVVVSSKYRRLGVGELLLKTNILLSKRYFNPKNIFLEVFEKNKPAIALYEKLGFRKFAVMPEWIFDGEYQDKILMKL